MKEDYVLNSRKNFFCEISRWKSYKLGHVTCMLICLFPRVSPLQGENVKKNVCYFKIWFIFGIIYQ